MRYYHQDGTYYEDPQDHEFGWYFSDIVIDEASANFKEHNEKIREISHFKKSSRNSFEISRSKHCKRIKNTEDLQKRNNIEESIDVLAELESKSNSDYFSETIDETIDIKVSTKPQIIQKIEPNVKIEKAAYSVCYQLSVEGFIENPESNFFKQIKNCRVPSKEHMMGLINPINPESKALLSVVSYSRYRSLNEKETNDDVLRSINFRATNSKHILSEDHFGSPFMNGGVDFLTDQSEFPNFSFLLNDGEADVDQQLVSEIQNYHATKEDNMLSLMMELIITDMDSNFGDMSELNHSVNELSNTGVVDTSDLGNSIHSSLMSKEGNGNKESKMERSHYLCPPNRSDILNSIGLSDDIDRSIEYFTREKSDMHLQLLDIKKSFEEDEKKVQDLIDQAVSLQNDLRETTYLDNLLHLLNGKPEKVKNRKLPFRIFHESVDDNEANFNLII